MNTDKQGAPDRIWLQLHGDASEAEIQAGPADCTAGDVSWHWEPVFDADVEYIREDIAEGLAGALQQILDEAAHLAGFSPNTETAVIEALARYREATK